MHTLFPRPATRCIVSVAGLLAIAVAARADGYVVYVDDRSGFDDALLELGGTSIVDSGGAFAPDPLAGTSLTSVLRSGLVGGDPFTYVAYDVDFSNAPTGTVTPGAVGGDVFDTDRLNVERPAAQSGAVGVGTWGLDSSSGSTSTRNALLVDFTSTPGGGGVGHFGLDLLDFEAATGFTSGELRLYDGGALVYSRPFSWSGTDGNGETHFLGVAALAGGGALFDQVALVVGDDSNGGGGGERWAADRLTFGQAVVNPEPASFWLLAAGLCVGAVVARRRRGARSAQLASARPR